jgi:hypothetical protein
MPELLLYEYATVRVVPRVEREEFVNVGVALYCKQTKFLGFQYQVEEARLLTLFPKLDLDCVRTYLASFAAVCAGGGKAGPISHYPPAERFRWLTATRSTIIQPSKVHPGRCLHPEAELLRLFEGLVG